MALTDDERDRLITWMDLNAPYYPRYESAYPDNPGGRMPLTFAELARLEKLCGASVACTHAQRQREQLDFDRPDCSRILAGAKDAAARMREQSGRSKSSCRGAQVLRGNPEGLISRSHFGLICCKVKASSRRMELKLEITECQTV